MSVQVYYGEDAIALDSAILALKKNYSRVLEYEELADPAFIQEEFVLTGLFEEKKLLICTNALLGQVVRGKLSVKAQHFFSFLQPFTVTHDIIFIEESANRAKYYKDFFPKALYREFRLSPYLFYMLDNFVPNNIKPLYSYFEKTLMRTPAEMILYMLKKRIRELLLLSQNELKGNYQPWQLGKLKKQLSGWTQPKLERIYAALYKIEEGVKTGRNPLSIEKSLGLLMGLYL